jgi:uncharacterized protein YeaO (DUF488 family)
MLKLKRVYDDPQPADGERILVDRLWPRGLKKEDAHLEDWPKDLAPSDDLRHWFSHDPERWEEFQQRYLEELEDPEKKSQIEALLERARQGPVTLVFAAKDEQRNNAVVLKQYLEKRLASSS